jgi:hypothetical protein
MEAVSNNNNRIVPTDAAATAAAPKRKRKMKPLKEGEVRIRLTLKEDQLAKINEYVVKLWRERQMKGKCPTVEAAIATMMEKMK